MANKFSPVVASNATAGDRLLFGGQAALQLSTGDLVMLVHDPSAGDPNKITLQVVVSHTTPSVIATLPAAASGETFSLLYPKPQTLSLCADASDNLYVFGPYGTSGYLAYQGFVKQAGLVWTPAIANVDTRFIIASGNAIFSTDAVWCNTGGGQNGAGHILVACFANTTQNACFILDAGKVLAGTAAVVQRTDNASFLAGGASATAGSNIDLASDGFGATSGLACSAANVTGVTIKSWGVSATGALTTGAGISDGFPTATLSATTKLRCVRFAPGQWAVIYPSSTHAGQLTVTNFATTSATGLTSADTGIPSNFPAPGTTLSWDVVSDPLGIWIYGWSTGTPTTMLRLRVTFPAGVTTVGAVTSDDTSLGATNSTIRSIRDPVDWTHADWQAYVLVSTTYSLIGDYSSLPVAPYPPTLLLPTNGAATPLASGGTLDWAFNSPLQGDAQTAYYLRRKLAGGLYQWWNGAAWTTGQVAATGGNETSVSTASTLVTFGAGFWTANATYTWSVQVAGTGSGVSGYSTVWTLTVAASPATPTLAASYDSANNRTVLTIGGTGTDLVLCQFSDDGGVTWGTVRGAAAVALVAGAATVYDYEIPANSDRSYRVAQWDPNAVILNNLSAWSITRTVTSSITVFYLSDPLTPGSAIQVHILKGTLATSFNEQLTEHHPLGRSDTVILADVLGLEDGAATFVTYTEAEEDLLQALVMSQKTLYLQCPDGRSFYMRINIPRPLSTPYIVAPGSYRESALSWRGQKRP